MRRLIIFLAFVVLPGTLLAQTRSSRLSLEVGFLEGAYLGERSATSKSGWAQMPERFDEGWDIGVAWTLSRHWDVVGRYRQSSYPGLISNADGLTILSRTNSEIARTELRFEVRRSLFRLWGFEAFAMSGLATIAGQMRGDTSRGTGLAWGLGASLNIGPVQLVGGAEHTTVFPDRALDWAGEESGSDGLVAASIRMSLPLRIPGRSSRGSRTSMGREPIRLTASIPPSALVGEEVTLSASLPETSEPALVQWILGDGTVLEGAIVRHRFTQQGDVPVRVRWQDDDRLVVVESTISILAKGSPVDIIRILSAPSNPVEGQEVSFSPLLSGGDAQCLWTFDDGSSDDRECETTHRFTTAGTFEVQLVVTNADGADIARTTIDVREDRCKVIEALRPVYFPRGSSTLSLDMRQTLRDNFSDSAACTDRTLEIRGFAFNTESRAEALAEARARSVMQYYLNLGMQSSSVEVVGYSVINAETHPTPRWTGRRSDSHLRLR